MKIKYDTLIRTVILGIALVNQLLTSMDKNPLPFSDETLYEFLTLAFTIGSSIWAWWKNNSFTDAAIYADDVMKSIKSDVGVITITDEDDETDSVE